MDYHYSFGMGRGESGISLTEEILPMHTIIIIIINYLHIVT
jgi:hypothetical protein